MPTDKSTLNQPASSIRASLLQRGLTVAGFARKHGFSVHTTRSVIYGRGGGPQVSRIRKALADEIKKEAHGV